MQCPDSYVHVLASEVRGVVAEARQPGLDMRGARPTSPTRGTGENCAWAGVAMRGAGQLDDLGVQP